LRRAVPCLRSDYRFEPNGTQGHNHGISFWIPFHGTGIESADSYLMRSHYSPSFGFGGPIQANFDFASRKKMGEEWREIADNFLGDYYPLTSYSVEPDVWMAWQFDRPEVGEGVLVVFRRAESPYETARFKLRGLDPDASYELKNFDEKSPTKVAGRELMDTGLFMTFKTRPTSAIISYKKIE
jgi:alpha-galactosidase